MRAIKIAFNAQVMRNSAQNLTQKGTIFEKFVHKFRKNCSYVHEVFFVKFRIFCALKAILITRNIYICGKKIFICFIFANANASIQEFSQTNQLFQNISIIDIEDLF